MPTLRAAVDKSHEPRSNARMRKSFVKRFGAVAVVVALLSAVAVGLWAASSGTPTEASPPAASNVARNPRIPVGFDERYQAIEASLTASTPRPFWAGRYFRGDGNDVNVSLHLAPDAGVVTNLSGCLGVYAANHGDIDFDDDGVIRMHYVASNEPTKGGKFPAALVPVRWGERQYMIPPDRIPAFVSTINHGYEPRRHPFGTYLLRDGDEAKPVAGLPVLPPGTQAQLRNTRVDAIVTAVERSKDEARPQDLCSRIYRLRFETTTDAVPPLFIGEELLSPNEFDTAAVLSTDGRSVDAQVVVVELCTSTGPKVGQTFTTGAYVDRQHER